MDPFDIESGSSEQPTTKTQTLPEQPQNQADEKNASDEEAMAKRQRQDKIYFRNRCIYLAFATILSLFGCWYVTSLTFNAFPRAIGPSIEIAKKALERIYTEPEKQGEMWEQCFREEGDRCHNETALAHATEAARVSEIQTSNWARVEQASMLQTQCVLRYSDGETALRDSVLAGDTLPWKDMCPAEDRDAILEAAGGDVRKGQEELIDVFARMSDENRQQLMVVTTFLEDSARYNRDYFFGRLTLLEADLLAQIGDLAAISLDGISLVQVTGLDGFNGIIACVAPVEGSPAICSIPSISASLNFTLAQFEGYLEITSEQIQQAVMVIAALVEQYDWAVANLEDFVRIFQGIRSVLGRPFDLALESLGGGIDLGQFSDLAPGRFFVPDGIDVPDFGELPSFQPALNDFRNEIRKLREGVRDVADQVSDELKDKVNQLVTNVREAFAGVFEDYDPPKYPGFDSSDFGGIIDEYDSRYEKFRAQFERVLQDIKLIRETTVEGDSYEFITDEVNLDQVEGYREKAPELIGLQLPTIPDFVLVLYMWLAQNYGILDILLRIWLFISRWLRFYHRSAVPTPKIIVGTPGTDLEEEEEQQREEKKPWWLKFLNVMFNEKWIRVALVVVAVAFFTISGIVLNLYIKHYQGRCVESRSGTFLAQGLILPTVHNPAKLDGNIAKSQEKLEQFLASSQACTSLGTSSKLIYRQQQESLFSIKYDYNKTMTESSRILDCIDLNALGDDGAQLHEDLLTCSLPMDITLENGDATCNQKCEIDCSESKITEAITKVVIENSCVYEWYLLSELIILFLKSLQYWGVAIASWLLEEAIFIFFRKFLRRDTVKYEYEEDVESNKIIGVGKMTTAEAKDEARKKHRKREIYLAVAEVFLAFAVTAIWIYVRINVARSNDFLKPKWFVEE